MNLPTAVTVARIAITPLIAALPFAPTVSARVWAFALFLVAANSDWVDGYLARSRKEETDLGKLLDPLADKLLLVGTFVPMYWLARSMPFHTPFGNYGLPMWVVAIVLGREVTMTWFRQYASRRGVIIAASWPAKWKTSVTAVWQGAAYCWFWVATLADQKNLALGQYHFWGVVLGLIGAVSMSLAVGLTLYSLFLYVRDYGKVLGTRPA
ncbi:MAG: CDP-alcohol phosphatidyltransferase family protein [Gemmatimonadota bacterium]